MEIRYIESNRMRLDGGAMFGNAPKEMWKKWVDVDEKNCIPLATRCVLLKGTELGNILIDAGAGHYLADDLLARYHIVEGHNALEVNLKNEGVTHEEVDRVLLSHLHFDHVGGLVNRQKDGLKLLFPNATFYISKGQWDRAQFPHHPRDRVYTLIQEILQLIKDSGRLQLIDSEQLDCLSPVLQLSYSNGHAYHQFLCEWQDEGETFFFPSDLIPGKHWVHLPITMGYDRFPELIVDEKTELLKRIEEKNGTLIFVHDPDIACCKVRKTEKGSYETY